MTNDMDLIYARYHMAIRAAELCRGIRAGDALWRKWSSYIDRQTFVGPPNWDCNIARSAMIHVSKNSLLFHYRRQHAFLCDLVQQVSNTVMTMNTIR